jgi:hypothetical protein
MISYQTISLDFYLINYVRPQDLRCKSRIRHLQGNSLIQVFSLSSFFINSKAWIIREICIFF